jgi:hypothetical protein
MNREQGQPESSVSEREMWLGVFEHRVLGNLEGALARMKFILGKQEADKTKIDYRTHYSRERHENDPTGEAQEMLLAAAGAMAMYPDKHGEFADQIDTIRHCYEALEAAPSEEEKAQRLSELEKLVKDAQEVVEGPESH